MSIVDETTQYKGYEIQREILAANDSKVFIRSIEPAIIAHISDKRNYVDFILYQINKEKIYDFLFNGKSGQVVLDLGANVGLFTLYAQATAAKVISLEPTPSHASILKHLTSGCPHVLPLELALSSTDAPVSFFIHNDNPTMNSLANQSGEEIKVKGIRLSTLLALINIPTIDIVKCDIEGSEMAALSETELAATYPTIKQWFIEAHAAGGRTLDENREELARRFQAVGYTIKRIGHDTLYAYRPGEGA